MFPYYYPSSSTFSDSDYLRALAEERAAREQYVAARRAQEEARERAARARAARRSYLSPYSSYHDDEYPYAADMDLDMDPLDAGVYGPPQRLPSFTGGSRPLSHAGFDPYRERERAILEDPSQGVVGGAAKAGVVGAGEEKERRRLDEERIRRILQEERQREEAARQKLIEEERIRRALEEERIRRAMLEEEAAKQSRQDSLEPLLRALGFVPAPKTADSDLDKSRAGRPQQATPVAHRHTAGLNPSPVRPYPFGRSAAPTGRSPSPKTSTSPTTTSTPAMAHIPITSPRSAARSRQPSREEQTAAAEKIQDAYRAHASRKHALKALSGIRRRFLAARTGFSLPTTVDFDIGTHGRLPPTTVTVEASLKARGDAEDADADALLCAAPRLAYSPTNAPLHAYEEELNRLLTALDAVESRGDHGVRAARRELARAVEQEAERVERWRGIVWKWWTESQKEDEKEDVPAVEVSSSSSPAYTHTVEVEPAETAVADAAVQPAEAAVVELPVEVIPASLAADPTILVESPATPKVDIPFIPSETDPSEPTPFEPQVVEPPEPQVVEPQVDEPVPVPEPVEDAVIEDATPASTNAVELQTEPEQSSRPATPALTRESQTEPDTTDVEPEEALTPVLSEHPLAPVEVVTEETEDSAVPARVEQPKTAPELVDSESRIQVESHH
ncbi:uncharacterized protein BXZ73DRAFT_80064 [Epithele typhae]|uniref:uncharacterized protein n=1 Tax=Epithele typhae TaxID=378194 RepID=UPI0020079ED0|nr:uncharacterized protein BXZ73DRAFT_80064 [Epithele typhae]KAH9920870.1 hypothetical protein BXZ73DRAFT_80064 [Epithele typhae]